jgi:uncharacterized protein
MKTINFILFFSIFFTVYGLLNYYIFIRGWQSIPQGSLLRVYYVILFVIIALSFIIGRVLENYWLSPVSEAFVWIGSFWLGAMLYLVLAIAALDILRLLNHWLALFPSFIITDYVKSKQITAYVLISCVTIVLIIGYLNALKPQIRTLNLTIPKKHAELQSLNIVAASDIHLGTIVGRKRFDRIVTMINGLNPDIVLLPGDIVDEDIAPVIKENLGESLKTIKSRYGVFAITGNHEYIGGVEQACRYLADHNVIMLRDSIIKINNNVYLVGREDRSINRFNGRKRKSLEELLSQVDKTYPIILMDHQPFGLDEAAKNGVDLQLSGHTHHGQLWPLNLITKMVYEVSWGLTKKESTQFYISCGVGTWGPPIRVGNTPEIVNIRMNFSSK